MRLFYFLKSKPPTRRLQRRKIKKRDWQAAFSAHRRFEDGEIISYLGHPYRLRIVQDQSMPQGCRLRPRVFEINIHNISSPKILREEVRLEVRLWLKKRAKEKFARRTDLWAFRLDVRYRDMLISSPRWRWGSCNAQNVIRLSWHLVLAPLPLIDYVIAHELCHTVHKNHAKGFWNMLAGVMPDYRERRQHLKEIGRQLIM